MAQKKIGYGDFFCGNCGAPLEKKAAVCPHCSQPYDVRQRCGQINPLGAGGIGWSAETGNPCFKRKSKKNTVAGIIFLLVVCIIIFIAMLATGNLSLDSGGLKLFGILMAVLWTFWILWILIKSIPKKDWEGVVQSHTQKEKHYMRRESDGSSQDRWEMHFTTLLRTTDGKQMKIEEIDKPDWYEYLKDGELVRFHGTHMRYYEKYDKSKDLIIPCASCGAKRDTRENFCGKCGCILLKGQPAAAPVSAPVSAPVPVPVPEQTPAPAPAAAAVCPFCGSAVAADQNFCETCGGKL